VRCGWHFLSQRGNNVDAQITGHADSSWTWADKFSTYRFWGLVLFYGFWGAAASVQILAENSLLRKIVPHRDYTNSAGIGTFVAFPCGIFLAWAAVRWKTVYLLLIFALLYFAGAAMLILAGTAIPGAGLGRCLVLVGYALTGIASGAIWATVIAVLAGGRGGAEAFFVACALFTLLGQVLSNGLPLLGFSVVIFGADTQVSAVRSLLVVAVLVGISVVCLWPVNRDLFNKAPPPRGYTLDPVRRNPLTVALLCLIPVYGVYWVFRWMYRAHGEVASLAPSRSLLSPRAAVGGCFIPLFPAVLTTTLADAIDQDEVRRGGMPVLRAWAVCLWSLFCFPVAMAMIQAAMNRLIASAQAVPVAVGDAIG
jgi:hypothetical protein